MMVRDGGEFYCERELGVCLSVSCMSRSCEMRTNGVGDGIILGTTARRLTKMFGTGERIGFLFYDEVSDGGG